VLAVVALVVILVVLVVAGLIAAGRSMSRQAEAERERRVRIITADGEYQASKRLAAAANVMSRDPAALQLRLLQTVAGDSASPADFSDEGAAGTGTTSGAPLEIPEVPQLPIQVSNGKLPAAVVP
jgi:hypothetical protein